MNKNCHKINREAIDQEDLAIITKDDKSNLEIVDSQLNYQYQKLKEEFQKSRFEHKDTIAKYFTTFLQNYPMDNFDRINEFVLLYELEKQKFVEMED